jgi:K+-sensing histidine kinase KdpD
MLIPERVSSSTTHADTEAKAVDNCAGANGLIAFAQREGVTHVIFGQSARTQWELLLRGSALDKFLGAVPDAAVQVVPLTES